MVLKEERAALLSNFLVADKERALSLLNLEPEVAVKEINSNGYDFTVEEVEEFGKQLVSLANSNEELSEEALENVSGGVLVVTAGVLAAGVALFGAGLSASVAIGIAVANKKGW